MHRRRLVATATVGALASVLAAVTVASASLVVPPVRTSGAAHLNPVRTDPTKAGAWTPRKAPLVIAHRGASAYRPEHTLDAYKLAIEMGADYIEADLVMTSDGQLVSRHEHELSSTTDVAKHPEFTTRRKSRQVNGTTVSGWFTEDFTVAELKTLRTKFRRPAGGSSPLAVPPHGNTVVAAPPSTEQVPPNEAVLTLPEIVELSRQESTARKRPVGLYLELKIPSHFTSIGLAPEPVLVDVLRRAGLAKSTSPVFVQSFEPHSLRKVHELIDVPVIQLFWGATDPTLSPEQVKDLRSYASGVGVDRSRLRLQAQAPPGAEPSAPSDHPTSLVPLAHQHGLEVHVFTFANHSVGGPMDPSCYRPEDPPALADALAEYRAYFRLGVDGVFTDNPDVAVQARR